MEIQRMVKTFFNSLVDFLSPGVVFNKRTDYLTYAKTEYGSDWRYAYNYMMAHEGKAPRYGK